MEDEIILEKVRIIERCLDRVREEFGGDPARLESHTIEDALVLNLQRASEASIDLARVVSIVQHDLDDFVEFRKAVVRFE